MVKLTDPLHSGEARGSLAATTYCTWRGIRYARERVTPKTEYSWAQRYLRARTAEITVYWQTSTQTERDAWNAYAGAHPVSDWTGREKRLSGYNWYLKCSVLRKWQFGDPPNQPPDCPAPPPIKNIQLLWVETPLAILWTPQMPWEGGRYWTQAWKVNDFSPGRHPTIEAAHYWDMNYETNSELDDYDAEPGQTLKYFVRMWDKQTGLDSPWLSAQITIPED